MDDSAHQRHMRCALALAAQGVALTSPNPCVGAVLVSAAGEVIGEGSHTYDGVKHAEVLALEAATRSGAAQQVRGATLYINLEPCSHQGRTAPCADAVIAAGVARVVAAMPDPNPRVGGATFAKLRAAGVEVVEGILRDEAMKVNEWFAKYIRTRTPLVTLKSAMTLDGKISSPTDSINPSALGAGSSASGWITNETARAHVQELRHASDAIMVGVGTVVADDPLLTDRTGRARRRPLLRVILDSRLRLPLASRMVKTAQNDVLVLCAFAEEKKKRDLEARGIRVTQIALTSASAARPYSDKVRRMPVRRRTGTGKPILDGDSSSASDGRPDLRKVIAALGELEITSLLIEGGALVNGAALAAGIVDKILFYYAPRILGGADAIPFASGAGFRSMAEAAQVHRLAIHRFGEDVAVEGYLRDPYEQTASGPQELAAVRER